MPICKGRVSTVWHGVVDTIYIYFIFLGVAATCGGNHPIRRTILSQDGLRPKSGRLGIVLECEQACRIPFFFFIFSQRLAAWRYVHAGCEHLRCRIVGVSSKASARLHNQSVPAQQNTVSPIDPLDYGNL